MRKLKSCVQVSKSSALRKGRHKEVSNQRYKPVVKICPNDPADCTLHQEDEP